MVEDAHQGRGIGSVLLEHLAAAARETGISRFVAEVLPTNGDDAAGLRRRRLPGAAAVRRRRGAPELPDRADRAVAARCSGAASTAPRPGRSPGCSPRAASPCTAPAPPATASARPSSATCATAGSPARSCPCTRARARVAGLPAVTGRRRDAGTAVDLARRRRAARRRSPRSWPTRPPPACTVSSWSPPASPRPGRPARPRSSALIRAAHAAGMRVVGPNCLGIANTDPAVRLNATLAPRLPAAGPGGLLQPVRRARGGAAGRGGPARARACPASSRPATAPTCPATTCCSTGGTIPAPTRSCSTWRRSATRASSPGWPGSIEPGQAGRGGGLAGPPARAGAAARPARTPARSPRCSPAPA